MNEPFQPTRWTLVARSREPDAGGRAALSELCAAYYEPVVAFLRQDGRDPDTARDLAHDFFARLLKGGAMQGADPRLGKFRSYLLAALKHFLGDQRAAAQAIRRGGGQAHAELSECPQAADTGPGPDSAFDRQWAVTLLGLALDRLENSLRAEGKQAHFEVLKPWLTTEADAAPQSAAAASLGLSVEAVKVAVHRLRKRFRAAVREEIAQTLADPASAADELASLMAVLRG